MARLPSSSPTVSSQLMSNHSYEITHYRDKDLKTVGLHSHDFFELYYFISGNASYIIENVHYRLQPGDVLLISPQNLHQLDIFDSSVSYERMVLWLNPRYVKKLSSSKTDLSTCFKTAVLCKNYLIRDYRISEKLRAPLVLLSELEASNSFGDDIAAETLIQTILLELSRYTSAATSQTLGNAAKKPNNTVSRLLEYIEENLDKDLSLDHLAEHMLVSKFYLERLFRDETNSTLHKYILKKRLLLSKKYIEQGQYITEVYHKCGFADYSHFFRAFKQEYSITPKQYYALITLT